MARIRVSEYIADFLVCHEISTVFTVTGGGAMYLNDSLGHHSDLHCVYNHHEQASAMAAEAYARIDNRIAAVCVTTGPGATNAITGVVCGWMDSIPMLILSGQARYETTVYASGLQLRTRGVQEFDIIGSVRNMTKYAVLVHDPMDIRYCLERALYTAKHDRPGPCWLDIPLDVQGALIETDDLRGFIPEDTVNNISARDVQVIIEKIRLAHRPLLFVGNGVRLAGAHDRFLQLVDRLNIPVVVGMSSVDAIATDHPLYAGRTGTTGDRAGNFAVQNCDLLLSLGSRLSYFQTGFNHKTWAPNAYVIANDIDSQELEKDSIHADMRLCGDVSDLINALQQCIPEPLTSKVEWADCCQKWRQQYPVVLDRHYADPRPNIYSFYKELSRRLTREDCLVASCGTSRVVGSQACEIREGMRFITNPSTASMGYDLPAAIGVCVARNERRTILVTGDGSLQMNLQELQTIVHNRLPIMIFVMNNQGYHSIRMTQKNFFGQPLVGVGPESHDLSFPDLSRIANAYGVAFRRCDRQVDMTDAIEWTLQQTGPVICEMMLSTEQVTEPKVASRRLPSGQMESATFENMAPFLPLNEVEEAMAIARNSERTPYISDRFDTTKG